MEQKFLSLTPKRKSILWNYRDGGCAGIVALKSKKQQELNRLFNDEISDLNVSETDGLGVLLNFTGTKIWEQCDGVTTVDEMLDNLSLEFELPRTELINDLKEFIEYCDKVDILDMNWRSIT